MLVGSTNQVFFKAFSLSIHVDVHECNMCIGEQKFQRLLRWAYRTAYIWRPVSDFRLRKESDFPEWLQSHTRSGDVAILDAKISVRIRYGNLAHVSDVCRQKHCIPNCGQKAADRDMGYFQQLIGSRYRSIQRYHQLLTTYRLATIHLLRLKRRLRDDISYPRLNLPVGYNKGNKIITVDFHDS